MKRVLAVMTAVLMTAALLSGCNSAKSKEYKILDEAFSDEEYVIGFRKGDETLRDEVQRILVEMKKDGKLAEIGNTWFGADNTTVPEEFTPSGASDDSLAKVKEKGTFVLGWTIPSRPWVSATRTTTLWDLTSMWPARCAAVWESSWS